MASPDLTHVPDLRATTPVAAEVDQVARELGVDPARGLSAEEARSRLESHGPNRLAGGKKEPGWRAFLRQYEDFMQVILLARGRSSTSSSPGTPAPPSCWPGSPSSTP